MKITYTEQRECCAPKDLKPVADSPHFGRHAQFMFCVHCGKRHEYATFMDAAGSSDWEYRPIAEAYLLKPAEGR